MPSWRSSTRSSRARSRPAPPSTRSCTPSRGLVKHMARTSFATRLRPALAQPWIDTYAEFGVIPKSFAAIELVK
jgi:hypothetical protein